MQSLLTDVPAGAAPDLLLTSAERRKKKQKERSKVESEEMEKNTLYGIVSSPAKDSSRLTLKLSRVKSAEMDEPQQGHVDSDQEAESINTNNQLSRTPQDLSHELGAAERANCQQVPVWPNIKDAAVVSGVFDDAEMDTLAEIERVERDSASERERWSKEVQDKGNARRLASCIDLMPLFCWCLEKLTYITSHCR